MTAEGDLEDCSLPHVTSSMNSPSMPYHCKMEEPISGSDTESEFRDLVLLCSIGSEGLSDIKRHEPSQPLQKQARGHILQANAMCDRKHV